jgi:hypothetical protein
MQTINATSVGNVAMNLRTTVASVERAADRLKLEPVLVLDHVRHYDADQIEKIRNQLRYKR